MESKEKAPVTTMSVRMKTEITPLGGGVYKGMLHSQYLEEPYEFFTLVRMIGKMEEIFDLKNFPQAFFTPRTFSNKKGKPANKGADAGSADSSAAEQSVYKGSGNGSCTFEILVKFRQNASWQGQILWVERDIKRDFLSELEMLKLIDEALLKLDPDARPVAWNVN